MEKSDKKINSLIILLVVFTLLISMVVTAVTPYKSSIFDYNTIESNGDLNTVNVRSYDGTIVNMPVPGDVTLENPKISNYFSVECQPDNMKRISCFNVIDCDGDSDIDSCFVCYECNWYGCGNPERSGDGCC